jgi:hypothetical protein
MAGTTTQRPATKSPGARSARSPAPKAAGKASAAPRRRRSSGSALVTLTVIGVTVLAVTALPLCILLLAGMLPTFVAVVVDRHRRRYLARTVGAMNIAGLAPAVLRLWVAGITFANLHQVVANPFTWLVMYGGAGFGWLLYFGIPPVVGMLLEINVEDTKRQLEARAKTLVEEWGEEVTGRAPSI